MLSQRSGEDPSSTASQEHSSSIRPSQQLPSVFLSQTCARNPKKAARSLRASLHVGGSQTSAPHSHARFLYDCSISHLARPHCLRNPLNSAMVQLTLFGGVLKSPVGSYVCGVGSCTVRFMTAQALQNAPSPQASWGVSTCTWWRSTSTCR